MSARIRGLQVGFGVTLALVVAQATPAAAKTRTITVNSAAQLVAAIGSNRTIRVAPGRYVLDQIPRTSSKHVRWTKVHDGWQLEITNVSNLTLAGSRRSKPRLLVDARYAWVLKFSGARNVRLRNLVLGHTHPGYCVGGVVGFDSSRNLRINNSELFGSGTIGVGLTKVVDFHMTDSLVHDCTYGIMSIDKSSRVRFSRSTFRHNQEFDLIEIRRSPNVRFEACTVTNNRTNRGGGYALFKLDKRSSVTLRGGRYHSNVFDTFINRPGRMRLIGSARFKRDIRRKLQRADPRFNQIYRITRYRRWIVAATQAGIVFWNPRTGQTDLLHKAFISNSLLVDGKYLWVGTYRNVFRFDGLRRKRYMRTGNARGHAVFRGPQGDVWARQGSRYWRYDSRADRLAAVNPRWAPGRSYDIETTPDRSVWSIDFMTSIRRYHNGSIKTYRLGSSRYPGRDPRSFYVSPTGELWVSDFGSGFYRYDDVTDRFVHDPTVADKGAGIAIQPKRNQIWLGHYTNGVYLKRGGQKPKFFAFHGLGYMRDIHADASGDLWVAGWNALVRLYRSGGTWNRQRFVVR